MNELRRLSLKAGMLAFMALTTARAAAQPQYTLVRLDDSIVYGSDINDSGQVSGGIGTAHGWHAILYSNGSILDLGTLGGPGSYADSFAEALNNRGEVIGNSYIFSENHVFLYGDGMMRDLTLLTGSTFDWPIGINDKGDVVFR